MSIRRAAVAAVFVLVSQAAADPKGDIAAKTKEAMESYDLMDYGASKKLLNQALAAAKKAKLDKDPSVAKVYLALGITSFAEGDADAAKVAFLSAVQIDSKIQIEPAYRSPEITKLLEAARGETGGAATVDPGVDCTAVKGLQHTIIDTAPAGKPQPIEVLVGGDVSSDKLSVFYRPEKSSEFVEAKLTRAGDCKFTGEIPAASMKGSLVHYYVAALGDNNKPVSSRGSSGSPNIIELTAAPTTVGVKGDTEDPINGNQTKVDTGVVTGGVVQGGKRPKVYIQVAGGTGFGYVSGKTEFNTPVMTNGLGNSIVVVTPELGYHATAQLSIGLAGRLGFPLGANIDGPMGKSSTLAPSALLRARYTLSRTGEGIRLMGQLGAGIVRNTIKLDTAMNGDTDIVAQGPLLVGAGIGYTKRLSRNLSFVGDLSVLGAIAVVDKVGNAPNLNSGVGADLSLGLAIGF